MKAWDLKINVLDIREKHIKALGKDIDYNTIREIEREAVTEVASPVAQALVEMTNTSVCRKEDLANAIFDGITRSHRYLQGEFWMVMKEVIRKYSETEWVDARNQFAKDMCREFIDRGDV